MTPLWRTHAWIAYLAVFVAVIGHASSEFLSVLSGVAGPELSVWRFGLGAIGLVLIALARPESRDLVTPLRADGAVIVATSLLGVTAAYLMFHWSLDFATVPQVATMVTTIPIFVALANLAINREPISRAKIVGGVAAVLGVALLLTDGYVAQLAGAQGNLFGVLLAAGCAASIAFYMVWIRPIIMRHGALRIITLSMVIGAIGLWLLVGIGWGLWVDPMRLFEWRGQALVSLMILALYNTAITQFLWIGGLAAVPDVTRGSYLFFLKPVVATALALAFLGQELSLYQAFAIIVICASVAFEAAWGRDRAGRRSKLAEQNLAK